MKTISRSWSLVVVVGVLLTTANCAKGEDLTRERLGQAAARWQQASISSYRMTLEITGDRIKAGTFEIEVIRNKIKAVSRNGKNIGSNDRFYSLDGLFKFLDDELEIAKEPARYFNAPSDTRVYLRAHFDPKLGYPTRYLRSVVGTDHNITLEVVHFEAIGR